MELTNTVANQAYNGNHDIVTLVYLGMHTEFKGVPQAQANTTQAWAWLAATIC